MYRRKKRKQNSSKKKHKIAVKEIKLRPNIGQHDLEVKIKNIARFIDHGDKVKITMFFRGREVIHKKVGDVVIDKILDKLKDKVKLDTEIKKTQNQTIIILVAN